METLNTIYTYFNANYFEIMTVYLLLLCILCIYQLSKRKRQYDSLVLMYEGLKDYNDRKVKTIARQLKIIDNLGQNIEELEKELKETKENRDKIYHKHGTQIAYFKKRVIAYRVAIKTIFKDAPQFVILLQNEFYEHAKKNLTKLRKEENKLDKKEK